MKTIIQVEVEHKKPLPETPITDIVSQRTYMWLYSQGCESGVKATLMIPTQQDSGQGEE